MKIIAKISVFIFLLCQLTTSFANNPTTNIEPEDDCYVAVLFVQEGNVLIEMARMDIDTKYLNKEGSTVEEKVDLEVIKGLFNIKKISKQKGLNGKNAVLTVMNNSADCAPYQQESYDYCYTSGLATLSGQCVGENILIPGWCVIADYSYANFSCGYSCTSFEF